MTVTTTHALLAAERAKVILTGFTAPPAASACYLGTGTVPFTRGGAALGDMKQLLVRAELRTLKIIV